MLSGRGLCDELITRGAPYIYIYIYIYDISRLRVKSNLSKKNITSKFVTFSRNMKCRFICMVKIE